MPYSDGTRRIQQLLNAQYGTNLDQDGYWGPATEKVILAILEGDGVEKDDPPKIGVDVLEYPRIDLEWRTQFDSDYCNNRLIPGGDTIRASGCLASCCAMILGTTVPEFVEEMNDYDGFDTRSRITWSAVQRAYGKQRYREIGLEKALEHLKEGTPVILHFPRGHFVVAIGLEDENHFRVLDPGSGMGNGNTMDNAKTIISFDSVDRHDVLL